MSDPQNNFLIFNENNNQGTTLSQGDYLALAYRISGLIPMIADPIAHNKMYRQWSLMCNAIGAMINDKNLDALDTNSSDLKNNLKTAVKGLARDELQSEIITLGNIDTWKESITATPAEINTLDGITASTVELNILDGVTATATELNILDGVTASTAEINILHGVTASTSEINTLDGITASTSELNILDGAEISTTELNYLDGANSNIQTQIDSLSISALFPLWQKNKSYSVGDVVKTSTSSFWVYLECVVAGTSGTTMPANANVGQLVTDNEIKWLICDWRDSNPVGSIKHDLIKRDGWLKLTGGTVNVADYPRLVNFLITNSLIKPYTATPNVTEFTYGNSNNETLILPDFTKLFIESGTSALVAKSAGLPNITGSVTFSLLHTGSFGHSQIKVENVTGVFESDGNWTAYPVNGTAFNTSASTDSSPKRVKFNASSSSSIYGNSSTVQPPAVTLIPIIKY